MMPDTGTLALTVPERAHLVREFQNIKEFQSLVHHELIAGKDYGIIPGTVKPTLLKPGAEKMAKLLGLADLYVIEREVEDWDRPLFRYLIKCRLVSVETGICISEGLGECNSMEARYRWRNAQRQCPLCLQEAIIKGKEEYGGGWVCFKKTGGCGGKFPDNAPEIVDQQVGRVPNDDIYSLVNTILKMARKRALVDAALSAGRLSDMFTQDLEDTMEGDYTVIAERPVSPPPPPKPQQTREQRPDTSKAKDSNTSFWLTARAIVGKDRTNETVHKMLQVNKMEEWLEHGYSLDDALVVLKALQEGLSWADALAQVGSTAETKAEVAQEGLRF